MIKPTTAHAWLTWVVAGIAVVAIALAASSASADEGRWTLRADVGFLGHSEIVDESNPDDRVYRDLDESFGMAATFEHIRYRHFALGWQFGVHGWRPESADDYDLRRNVFVDVDFLPTLRLPFGPDPNASAFYAGPVLGFTGSFLRERYRSAFASASHGFGLHAGLRAGFEIMVRRGGILAEVGYDVRVTRHRVDRPLFNDDVVAVIFRQPRVGLAFVAPF